MTNNKYKLLDESLKALSKDAINLLVLKGHVGCVDKDTEFFNGYKWKKINEYKKGDEVLQYNLDGSAELVKPIQYIKRKEDKLYLYKTKYGINQCLSKDHRIIYKRKSSNLKEKRFGDVMKSHFQNSAGFTGKIITTFNRKINSRLNLTDEQIRVMVAVHADGYFSCSTKRCQIQIKKIRKKKRLRKLLDEAKIVYKENNRTNGFSNFSFYSPLKSKIYSEEWFKCSQEQLNIISEECINWDGCRRKSGKVEFSSINKGDVDFIQYVWSSCGFRATINNYKRKYIYKGIIKNREDYTVTRTKRIYPTSSIKAIKDKSMSNLNKERIITKYKTLDGYSYCFQVPSGMLVLRREGRINITGNCGKTYTTLKYVKNNNLNYKYINNYATPLSFYKLVYENRNKDIIIFDDTQSINDPRIKSMLKSICGELDDGRRVVSYHSTSPILETNDLPPSFELSVNVILIFNDDISGFEPIINRGVTIDFFFNFDEMIEVLETFQESANIEQEVMDYVKENCNQATSNLSIRTLVILSNLHRASFDFKLFANEILKTDKGLYDLIELSEKDWCGKTGMSRSSYYYKKSKVQKS